MPAPPPAPVTLALVGYAAGALQVAIPLPQAIATRRGSGGVALGSWALSAFGASAWVGYATRADLAPSLVANALSVAAALAVVLALRGAPASRRALVVLASLALVILATVTPLALSSVLAVALTVPYPVPQAVNALRGRLAGVSPVTWALSLVTSTLWAAYGLSVHSWAIVAPSLVIVPSAATILVALARHRANLTDAPPPVIAESHP